MKKLYFFCMIFSCFLMLSCESSKSVGLCLSGGGARGAYEIGVWKALDEAKITNRIYAISGTSVGALNGALMASVSQAEAEKLWLEKIGYYQVLTPDYKKMDSTAQTLDNLIGGISGAIFGSTEQERNESLQKGIDAANQAGEAIGQNIWNLLGSSGPAKGVFSRQELSQIIDSTVSLEKLQQESSIKLYATALQKQSLANQALGKFLGTASSAKHTFLLNEQTSASNVRDILLASSAIPGVFDSVTLSADVIEDGKALGQANEFLDGGVEFCGGDNTPAEILFSDENISSIIVVYLQNSGISEKSKKLKELAAYQKKNLIEIIPSKALNTSVEGTLEFNSENALRLMTQGYNDAKMALLEAKKKL